MRFTSRWWCLGVLVSALVLQVREAQAADGATLDVSVTASTNPVQLVVRIFDGSANVLPYALYRRIAGETAWTLLSTNVSQSNKGADYVDTAVSVGSVYEYYAQHAYSGQIGRRFRFLPDTHSDDIGHHRSGATLDD